MGSGSRQRQFETRGETWDVPTDELSQHLVHPDLGVHVGGVGEVSSVERGRGKGGGRVDMDGSLGERVGQEGSSLEVLSSGHEGVVSQESRDDTCDVSFVRSDVKGLKERTRDVPPNIIGL